MKLTIAGMMLATLTASAAMPVREFTEDGAANASSAYSSFQRANKKADNDSFIVGGLRASFSRFSERIRVPGFVSASALPEIAQVIGPSNVGTSFRLGDTIFLRWSGSPGPREGDRYSTFTPAVVMQSLLDATEFQVRLRPPTLQELPPDFRMAGFFYEGSGTVRIVRIRQGIVEAVIERLSGQLHLSDQLMPLLPVKAKVTPITGGIQLAAAVVSGSPSDRLSTTVRSFVYINRGARDGIKEGRVFQAVDSVKLDGAINGPAPERSLGEAMVVHVTDSYSTAIITKQFEVVRIGSLLKSKQELELIPSASPFSDFLKPESGSGVAPATTPEIPEIGEIGATQDRTLPDPGNAPKRKSNLSELDQIEQGLNAGKLSAEERARLGRLSRQEKLDAANASEDEEPAPIASPSLGKAKPKAKAKKKKKSNDEEELNLLMLQN
ncbi:MAG: hypothetical protein EOP11_09080 [Proteobacteria bacterium]|nr:MAG: hypothetical protein EOP11_09080 [Pseudomonadota bacterium]